MNKDTKKNWLYIIFTLVLIFLFQAWWAKSQQTIQLDYSKFQKMLENDKIKRVAISENHIVGILKKPEKKGGPTRFETTRVDPKFAAELEKFNVAYDGRIESNFLANLLVWLLPVGLLILFWSYMIRRSMSQGGIGGLMQIGKSKAKIFIEHDTGTTFDDVAGVDEAKRELMETISFLKNPRQFTRLGARQPKGILLVGPPGTGKTLLARAVAGEAGVPFFSISGSEFIEMFVGVGAARVRDLFEKAKKTAPCIIFIDELDALGRARSASPAPGGHEEKEQTLNQLLNEMDGFSPREEIVILSATNQPQVLDQALLRPGRFDRQVLVDKPDKRGRLAILKVHVQKIKLADHIDLDEIAGLTTGFSGADIENLVNEAAIVATRRQGDSVTNEDFTIGMERIVAGLEKKGRILSDSERKTVAYHELGHALVAWLLPGVDPVHKVSIIPRSIGALGYTMQRPTEDRYLMDERELKNKMIVLLGGRAAEKFFFDRITTGAADDIAKASDIARAYVMEYGMDQTLGPVSYEKSSNGFLQNPYGLPRERRYSEETAREIDAAVRKYSETAFERAVQILEGNREILEDAAKHLLEVETLDKEALKDLFSEASMPEKTATLV